MKKITMELSVNPTKLEGEICIECGKEEIWYTCYIGYGVPNVKCHFCGFKWIIMLKTKLEVKGDLK